MKKIILFLVFQITIMKAQTSFVIDDFSSKFYAKIVLDDSSKSFEKTGKTIVYRKADNTVLITSDSISLPYMFNEIDNKKKLLYKEQSMIIFGDFNFDSNPDLAIYSGDFSCYSGPAYDVYLYKNNTFEYNQDFTDLAVNNCGFFDVNSSKKQLSTFSKSGCSFIVQRIHFLQTNKKYIRAI